MIEVARGGGTEGRSRLGANRTATLRLVGVRSRLARVEALPVGPERDAAADLLPGQFGELAARWSRELRRRRRPSRR